MQFVRFVLIKMSCVPPKAIYSNCAIVYIVTVVFCILYMLNIKNILTEKYTGFKTTYFTSRLYHV